MAINVYSFLAFIDLVSCVAIPLTVSERRSCGLQGVAVVTAKCGDAEIWRSGNQQHTYTPDHFIPL
jgi:hypothetical protein